MTLCDSEGFRKNSKHSNKMSLSNYLVWYVEEINLKKNSAWNVFGSLMGFEKISIINVNIILESQGKRISSDTQSV